MNKQIITKKLQKLFTFKGYDVPEMEIKKRVVDSTHLFHLGIMVVLIFIESYFLIKGVIRYGTNISGVHLYRRYLYAFLAGFALLMTLIQTYMYKKRLYNLYQKVSIVLPIIIIGWGCGMTVLDCFNGNDISVFTYTMLVVAALTSNVEFAYSASIFVFYTVLLNILLYRIPVITYHSAMRVNSVCACALSFLMVLFVSYQNKTSLSLEIKNEELLNELAYANQKLELKSTLDGLTGLYNRRFLEKLVEGNIANNLMPVGAIMIDIDKFKEFNDTYGHINGDVCLKYTAKKLLNIPDPENGYCIRYGGEEFLVLYYDISQDALKTNANTIFNSIRNDSFLIDGNTKKKITVSMGVFANTTDSLDIHEMIKNADDALYNAKEQGRDRIEWHSA